MKTQLKLFFIAIVASLFVFGCSNETSKNEVGDENNTPNEQEAPTETGSRENETPKNDGGLTNGEDEATNSETNTDTTVDQPTNASSEFERLKAEYFSEPMDENVQGIDETFLVRQVGSILLGFSAEELENNGFENAYLTDEYFNENDKLFYEDFFMVTKLREYRETESDHKLLNAKIIETNENGMPIHTWYHYEINLLSDSNAVYTEERIYETVLNDEGEEKIKSYYR